MKILNSRIGHLLTGDSAGHLNVWDMDKGQVIQNLKAHSGIMFLNKCVKRV